MVDVTLVAVSRKADLHRATALRDIDELPNEGDDFQVHDLGYSVRVWKVRNTPGLREVEFRISGDDVTRLAHKKGWTTPQGGRRF